MNTHALACQQHSTLGWAPARPPLAAAGRVRRPRSLLAPALRSTRQPASTAGAVSKLAAGFLENPLAKPFIGLVGTPLYVAAEAVVLLGMLALTDAAYSGDWSRIGAISADFEKALQAYALIAWGGHVLCGALAAAIVRDGVAARSAGSAAFKAFLFGALHVFAEAVIEQQQLEAAAAAAAPAKGQRRR